MTKPNIIAVYGPTASGKSSYALHLAKKHNGIIINGDSQQFYKDLPILSANPTNEDKEQCPHYLYEILRPEETMNVVSWVNKIIKIVQSTDKNTKIIICGGTGFYMKILSEGLSPIPSIDETYKNKVIKKWSSNVAEAYSYLKNIDAEAAKYIHPHDQYRILRAISVCDYTGKKISDLRRLPKQKIFPYDIKLHYHTLAKDQLHHNIENRLHSMVKKGVINEVARLIQANIPISSPIYRIIGSKILHEYCYRNIGLDEALQLMLRHTKQYAKRQETFFKTQLNENKKYQVI